MTTALVLVALALPAACSNGDDRGGDEVRTVRSNAEAMIERTVAEQADLGDLRATCDEVDQPAVGVTFECTAVTDGQRTMWFDGTINGEGRVELMSRNVITAAALPSFERVAVQALNDKLGTALSENDVDCGDRTMVLGNDQVMVCAVTDPNSREVFDLTMTMTDIEARKFSLVVGTEPRQ